MVTWAKSSTIWSYGGREMPEASEIDFPDEFGGRSIQVDVAGEIIKFWNEVQSAVSWTDEIPNDLLEELWID